MIALQVLIKMLPSYHQHVSQYENSLVTRFYGVHCVKPAGSVKVFCGSYYFPFCIDPLQHDDLHCAVMFQTRFIVMGNLCCSDYRIHRKFDLKGSSHGRMTYKPEREIDETTTLKDLDLNYVFRVQSNWYQELMKLVCIA